jgi:FG-GAP-like repeat
MSQHFQRFTTIVAFGAVLMGHFTGCSETAAPKEASFEQLGSVQASLTGVSANGTVYRLREAFFTISGSSESTFSSEDYLGESNVRKPLIVGNYQIALADGWYLERSTDVGYEPVTAELTSVNPVDFTVERTQTSYVAFEFLTDSGDVTLGKGSVDVSILVAERPPFRMELGVPQEVGQQPTYGRGYITSGDLNRDGWPDIALAHGYETGAVLLNRQDATFTSETVIVESWWNATDDLGATSATLADLDGDGLLDYVFAIYGAHYAGNQVQLYKGTGDGSYAIPTSLPLGLVRELNGANPLGTRVADFDHNGLPDIMAGNNNGGHTVDIMLQKSPWVFAASYAYNQYRNANPQWPDVGDFNNDGWTDLVVPFLYGPVEVYLNTADGTGAMRYEAGYLSAMHHQVAIADFDGDGYQDIAARASNEAHVDVLYNDGSGHFPTTNIVPVSGSTGPLRAGDLDGDGTVDLVVSSASTTSVDLLLNDGSGSFHDYIPYAIGEITESIALDDFDQDGDIDAALYTTTYNVVDHIRILWNQR